MATTATALERTDATNVASRSMYRTANDSIKGFLECGDVYEIVSTFDDIPLDRIRSGCNKGNSRFEMAVKKVEPQVG